MPAQDLFIVGAGYVGLTLTAAWADLGHRVACIDTSAERVAALTAGRVPLSEPGVPEAIARARSAGRITFHAAWPPHPGRPAVVFVAVGTPPLGTGGTDLTQVRAAVAAIHAWARPDDIVAIKSTVPVGTGDWVAAELQPVPVLSNPEFLREGSALSDFLAPDRTVVGGSDPAAISRLCDLYEGISGELLVTDRRTGELIKYASNCYLANRLSFVNELAALCEQVGADVGGVVRGMGLDRRIGAAYLQPGPGYGGSCLPKDVASVLHQFRQRRTPAPLLRAVAAVNAEQPLRLVQKLRRFIGRLAGQRVAVLGLAFKPGTDDLRASPALVVLDRLRAEGALTRACDPLAAEHARQLLSGVEIVDDPYLCVQGADGLILVTDWPEYRSLDLHRLHGLMRQPVIIDGRNAYDPRAAVAAGFYYAGVGRAAQPRLAGTEAR